MDNPFELGVEPSSNKFFTSQEIRQFTKGQPETIGKADFFCDVDTSDLQLCKVLGYSEPKLPKDLAPQGSRAAAGDNSLVQRRKSPTEIFPPELTRFVGKKKRIAQWRDLLGAVNYSQRETREIPAFANERCQPIELDWQKNPIKCLQAHGFVENAPVMARLMHREWSKEWRIRVQAETRPSEAPPMQSGDRFTEQLTEGAVRKIFESGAYVQVLRGGYTTFATLTFDDQQREAILTSKPQSKNRTKPGVAGTIVVMNPQGRDPMRLKASGAFSWLDDMGKEGELAAINMENASPTGLKDQDGRDLFTVVAPSIRASGPWTKIRDYCPDSSIGNEVSRFIDLAQKTYQRGWIPDFMPVRVKRGQNRVKHAGEKCGKHIADGPFTPIRRGDKKDKIKQNPRWKVGRNGKLKKSAVPLDYCWVAEMPANENGEPNPHVHLLMRWRVPKTHFHAWAGRLERLWGNGFGKLEKIKHAKAGAGYLVKAVGYAAKGREGNQGLIRGNRYGISAIARAKGWECVASFQADNMAAIIAECQEKLARTNAHHEAVAVRGQIKRKEAKRQYKIAENSKKLSEEKRAARIEKLKARMEALDEEIEGAYQAKRERGVFAAGHYQITFTGSNSTRNLDNFLGWAYNNRQWQANTRNEEIKDHLEQAKRELVSRLGEEHQELSQRSYITDLDIKRLDDIERQLGKVQDEIDTNRYLRLQMANNLRQQRSYWRSFNSSLAERRTSLDYWAAFYHRYEPEEEHDDHQTIMETRDEWYRFKSAGY